ncbi:MAG: RNA methyltransferase [Muribaculaceae bacterium]|nr:RNA methyltransferase [Muribaculaceae bacterium]
MEKKTIWDLDRVDVETFRRQEKLPVAVVLDNVRSLNNIGSIFRTADGFAIDRVVLCGISACPPSPEIHKTALGAEDSVKWQYYESTLDAVEALRAEGFIICCLEQVTGSIELQDFKPQRDGKYVIVAGHEVQGVDQKVVDAADHCLEIPQHGTKHSLNVAVSTAIAIWHFYLNLR